jgi:hypothetical protein
VSDDSLTAADIAQDAVTSSELADNSVDTAAIQADAVTGAKVSNGSLTTTDFSPASNVVSFDPVSVGALTCVNQTISPVNGVAVNDHVIISAPSTLNAGLVPFGVVQPTANTVTFRLCNFTAAAINAAAANWGYVIIR